MMKAKKVLMILIVPMILTTFTACNNHPNITSNPGEHSGVIMDRDPFVKSIEIVSLPKKTFYFVGEIFEPRGLLFHAIWDIDGEEELVEDMTASDCDGYTLKNTPLTVNDSKVTFTIGGYHFDIDISVKEKVLGEYTLTLSEGTFASGEQQISLKEGEKLPSINYAMEGFEGWYYFDDAQQYQFITDVATFQMPAYDIVLKPIVFKENVSCTSRWAGGNTIPPVYNSSNNKVEAGSMDHTSEGFSDYLVKYTINPALEGSKIFGNNGAHLKKGNFFVKWTFTYLEGDELSFDFALDKDNKLFLEIKDILINENNKVAECYVFSQNPPELDNNTRSFVIQLKKALTSSVSFTLSCKTAAIE